MGSLHRSAALVSSALLALPLAASAQPIDVAPSTARAASASPTVESRPTNSTPSPSPSPALDPDARFTLRYSVPVDVTITAVGAVGWIVPELLKRPLTGPSCRWCERAPDGTRTVNALDTAVRDGLRWSNTSAPALVSDIIGYGLAPASAIGLTVLVGRLHGGGPQRDLWALWDALIIAETAALAMDVNQLVKFIALRERPRYQFATDAERAMMAPPGDEILSFFSGHTTFTFALATSAGMVSSMRGYRLAPLVWAAGLTLATSAAYLRIAADRHYFTDVLTGVFVGAGMGVLLPWLAHRPLFAQHHLQVGVAPIPNGAGLSLSGTML